VAIDIKVGEANATDTQTDRQTDGSSVMEGGSVGLTKKKSVEKMKACLTTKRNANGQMES